MLARPLALLVVPALLAACGAPAITPAESVAEGVAFASGRGVPRNDVLAVERLRYACSSGFAQGCGYLASMIQAGRVGPVDLARVATLHGQACEGGYLPSCQDLAQQLEHGAGDARDLPRASQLYQRACNAGLNTS